ncbi:MAG: alkyl sulfatase C-terminal domain-containing protein [Mycobacterium sp.]|uniref:alkyl sulfatase C-terminal domain-containing protein n=1 Tax=Mycobacterium sp. TaxID=1785 RepID=UPI002610D4D2|nr:alkyl sulfatase C-terminal domain-containing protein [Mycobacterium sp.]MDI3313311.1 alkyl sulfatase C-terminal domain-containing protein [Mycobacterium sp.]
MLVHRKIPADPKSVHATVKLADKVRLLAVVMGDVSSPGLDVSGDETTLPAFLNTLDRPDTAFNIVTP